MLHGLHGLKQPAICNNIDIVYSILEEMSDNITERSFLGIEEENNEQLLRYIEENQVGYNSTLQGPFGSRKSTCIEEVYLLTANI